MGNSIRILEQALHSRSFTSGKQMDMAISALFPILLVVPLFDVLMYFNILPKIIGGIGWVLAKITRQPKFESFFGIEMMFLGNTEALVDQTNN